MLRKDQLAYLSQTSSFLSLSFIANFPLTYFLPTNPIKIPASLSKVPALAQPSVIKRGSMEQQQKDSLKAFP